MTLRIPNGSGAWSAAATWDTTTLTPSLHASINFNITNTDTFTGLFTAPNLVNACTGVLFFCIATGAEDWVVTLQENSIDTAAVLTIPAANRRVNSWVYARFAVPYVFTTTLAGKYRFKIRTANADTGIVRAWATGANPAFIPQDDRNAVPGSTDDIIIAGINGATVTLTIDGTQTAGSGTNTGLPAQVSIWEGIRVEPFGVLEWDTAASAQLSLKGNIFLNGGEVDMGTVASPYPTGKTAKLVFTPTATGDFGISASAINVGKFVGQGEVKTSTVLWKTKYVSGVGTAADPMIVSGSVDWLVGDEILVGATSNNATNYNETENRFVITKNSPTSYVLSNTPGGAESALAYTHTTDAWIWNVQRNGIITTNNAAKAWYFDGITGTPIVDIDWLRLENMGASSLANKNGFVFGPNVDVDYTVNYNYLYAGFVWNASTNAQTHTGLVACNSSVVNTTTGGFWSFGGSSLKNLVDCFAIKNANAGFMITASNGFTGSIYAISCSTGNVTSNGCGFSFGTTTESSFSDSEAHCNRGFGAYFLGGNVGLLFTEPFFGTKGYNTIADIGCMTASYNQLHFDCLSHGSTQMLNNYLALATGSEFRFHKLDCVENNNYWYNNGGSAQCAGASLADTTVRTQGSHAARLSPENNVTGFTWEFNIYSHSNTITSFFGFFRKNAAFGASVARVELWMPGAVVPTDTVTLTNDTEVWQAVALSAFNSDVVDSLAIVKVIAISATAGAYLYADDFYNAGDMVTTYDKVTGLDVWYHGKPVQIISPQVISVADVWSFATTTLTAPNTTGKALVDILGLGAKQSTLNDLSASMLRALGLLMENHVEDDIVRNAAGLKTASTFYLYDSKAHAELHDKSTGLLPDTYSVSITYDGNSRMSLFKVVKN
jgi:hypothetical protein